MLKGRVFPTFFISVHLSPLPNPPKVNPELNSNKPGFIVPSMNNISLFLLNLIHAAHPMKDT